MRSRALALAAGGTTVLAALLAGCGGGSTAGTTSPGSAPASSAAAPTASAPAATPSSSAAAADPAAAAKAKAVFAAFAKAGLPTGTPVDHTADTCTPVFFDCTAFLAADKVSVMVFPDSASTAKAAQSLAGTEVHAGDLLARFGDPAPAPAVQQRYQKVLAAQAK